MWNIENSSPPHSLSLHVDVWVHTHVHVECRGQSQLSFLGYHPPRICQTGSLTSLELSK